MLEFAKAMNTAHMAKDDFVAVSGIYAGRTGMALDLRLVPLNTSRDHSHLLIAISALWPSFTVSKCRATTRSVYISPHIGCYMGSH